jgi:hypothetical protein
MGRYLKINTMGPGGAVYIVVPSQLRSVMGREIESSQGTQSAVFRKIMRCGKFRIFYVAPRAPNVFVLLKLSLRSYLEMSCASQTSFLF